MCKVCEICSFLCNSILQYCFVLFLKVPIGVISCMIVYILGILTTCSNQYTCIYYVWVHYVESPLRGAWALREEGKDTSLGRPLLDATYHKESGLAIVQRADDLGASPLLKPASDDKENK